MILRDYIDRKRLVDTFVELIGINAPSFGEREIGLVLAGKLERAGCTVELEDYGESFNLIGRKKGNDDGTVPLLLSGHMDTIEPTEGISFIIEDDLVRTTGATVLGADDKSALAQIIEALTVLEERKLPHGDLEIVFTSAEERGLCGAKHLDFERLRSRFALVLDSGGSVGRLVVAAPTHVVYEMTVTGRSAHAGIEPERGLSAIRVAAKIIGKVPDGRISADTTANIGVIRGGTATNVVAQEVLIKGEVRSHSSADLDSTKKSIFGTAVRVAREEGAQILITEEEEYEAFRIERDEPFLDFMGQVLRDCGIEPVHVATGGGSDANVFNHRGLRAINMSTGMDKVHSTEECISITELHRGCLVVLRAVTEFGPFSRKSKKDAPRP